MIQAVENLQNINTMEILSFPFDDLQRIYGKYSTNLSIHFDTTETSQFRLHKTCHKSETGHPILNRISATYITR
jgi:hypothetical protein